MAGQKDVLISSTLTFGTCFIWSIQIFKIHQIRLALKHSFLASWYKMSLVDQTTPKNLHRT